LDAPSSTFCHLVFPLSLLLLCASAANWQGPERAPLMQALQQQLDRIFNLPEGAWNNRYGEEQKGGEVVYC
jgi:hypothetical protein